MVSQLMYVCQLNCLQACCETLTRPDTAAVFGVCAPGPQVPWTWTLLFLVIGVVWVIPCLRYSWQRNSDQDRAEGVVECASEECLVGFGFS